MSQSLAADSSSVDHHQNAASEFGQSRPKFIETGNRLNDPTQNPERKRSSGKQLPRIDTGEQTQLDGSLESPGGPTGPTGSVPPPAPPARPGGPANPAGKPLPPPPPPPRSTLPPVSPAEVRTPGATVGPTEPTPRSGIGSANQRWRGELPTVSDGSPPVPATGEEGALATAEEAEHDIAEEVTRSAPSWLLSLVIHLIVLLILALLTSPVPEGFQELVVEFGIAEEATEDATELDLSTPIMSDTIDAEVDALDDAMVETEIVDMFENVEAVEQAVIQPDQLGPGKVEISKPMFGGRSGAMRSALMAMYGATQETQEAVKLGLAWLKRQQTRRGYWRLDGPYDNGAGTENRCAATAMAILAFAGDGNTHLEGPYRQEVEKGVKALVAMQDRNGFMASDTRGNDRAYAQAQATIALCELYGMTKDSWLRAYAQRAIDYAFQAQGPNGGWRYRPREPGDTSVTGWYVMAIQSAMAAGLEVKDSQVRKVSTYLDSAAVYYGAGYSYQPGQNRATPAMTAEGLLCRQYLGWERGFAPMVDGVNLLQADAPFDINNHDVYYWYYATQVFHHFGGAPWKNWNDDMKVKLPALQIREGTERGSWAPQRDKWSIGGRMFTTCLSIYCLEVYYRHLPLYDQE
ncbi:prenyltransferase/squalene oxidase repeat-containing protein [Roseiconus lacunae]|uniref:prenyltransferase/squalene oxidase repeat-containing protein n=1 Tax=Roseiconus lacunae TaxID=2605694 RepID=UPI001F269253|nr:prenyltransferase/squalene oxidase repeat-containing protein [Roseiconus lacunae]